MGRILTVISLKNTNLRELLPIAILPIIYFTTNLVVGRLGEPFYLRFNSDSPYAYLGSSLGISLFQIPRLVAHPGTPLQVLGAVLFRVLYIIRSALGFTEQPFPNDILSHSELSLFALRFVLLGLISIAIFISGITIFYFTQNYLASFLLQANPVFLVHLIPPIGAEQLLIFAANVLVILITLALFHGSIRQQSWYAVAVGTVLGFGLAAKFTFMPMLIFIFLAQGILRVIVTLGSTCVAFVLFTLPISPKYLNAFSWLVEASLRREGYTGGQVGIPPEFYNVGGYLARLFQNESWIFFGFFYSATVFYLLTLLLYPLWRTKLKSNELNLQDFAGLKSQELNAHWIGLKLYWFLGLIIGAFWLNVGLSFVEPNRLRYLVGAITLMPLALLFCIYLIIILVQTIGMPKWNLRLIKPLQFSVLMLCVALNIQQIYVSKNRIELRKNSVYQDLADIQTILDTPEYRDCLVVDAASTQRPSTQVASLEFASTWSGDRVLNQYLQQLYPNYVSLRPSGNRFASYQGRVDVEQIIQEDQCTLLRFRTLSQPVRLNIPNLTLEDVFKGESEHLSRFVLE